MRFWACPTCHCADTCIVNDTLSVHSSQGSFFAFALVYRDRMLPLGGSCMCNRTCRGLCCMHINVCITGFSMHVQPDLPWSMLHAHKFCASPVRWIPHRQLWKKLLRAELLWLCMFKSSLKHNLICWNIMDAE